MSYPAGAMAERDILYCTTEDGVRIAYTVQGEGTPLIMSPFFVEGMTQADRLPEYLEFVDGLGRGRRLIRYDMRGTGLSQRDVADLSLHALTRDIKAVTRTLKLRRFVLFGWGMSGPRSVAYAAAYPREVSHLVLYSTWARPDAVMAEEAVRGFAALARSNWEVAAQAMTDLSGREAPGDLNVRGARAVHDSTSGEIAASFIEAALETSDVQGMLGDVRARAMVVQGTDMRLFRAEFGHEIASNLPRAQLRLIDRGNWLDAGAGREVARIVDEFLGAPDAAVPPSPRAGEPSAPSFRAVLFTDLVGHTEMMKRLGDARGREVLREHEQITRDALARHGGTEVKTDGDSFMASFSSVTAAVDCAVALQRAFAARKGEPLRVRIGLNAGEPVEDGGDLFGASVILAARIKDQAGAGEILIPEPVRHLLAGKPFAFADRGTFVPKGFDDAVRLFEVRWQE